MSMPQNLQRAGAPVPGHRNAVDERISVIQPSHNLSSVCRAPVTDAVGAHSSVDPDRSMHEFPAEDHAADGFHAAGFPAGVFCRRPRRDRRRRARDAVSQPRRRPAAGDPRRAIRRRRRRWRRGVGARRPAVADDGRGRHHRILCQCPGACRRSRRCPRATSPPRCCWKICPAGRTSSIASDSATCRIPTFPASRWSAASAPRRPTGATSASSGAATSPDRAGASIPTMAAWSPSPPCSSTGRISCCIPATPSMPTASFSAEVKLADGKIWKNVTIPEKAKVAETLDEFRAAHKYNFLDDNVRAFNAEVPIFVQWDDHEVTNNWSVVEAAARRLQGARHLAARGARGPRLPRNVSDAREHRRAGPGLSHAQLRPASRRLHAGRAQLSRRQRPEPADQLRSRQPISSARSSSPG